VRADPNAVSNQRGPTKAHAQAASNEASDDWGSPDIADKFFVRDRARSAAARRTTPRNQVSLMFADERRLRLYASR
jgi:hypothetical protein